MALQTIGAVVAGSVHAAPEDVDAALGALAEERPDFGLGAFCMELADAVDGTTTPRIHVEARAVLRSPSVA